MVSSKDLRPYIGPVLIIPTIFTIFSFIFIMYFSRDPQSPGDSHMFWYDNCKDLPNWCKDQKDSYYVCKDVLKLYMCINNKWIFLYDLINPNKEL